MDTRSRRGNTAAFPGTTEPKSMEEISFSPFQLIPGGYFFLDKTDFSLVSPPLRNCAFRRTRAHLMGRTFLFRLMASRSPFFYFLTTKHGKFEASKEHFCASFLFVGNHRSTWRTREEEIATYCLVVWCDGMFSKSVWASHKSKWKIGTEVASEKIRF